MENEKEEITTDKLKAILEQGAMESGVQVKGELVNFIKPEQISLLISLFNKPKRIALVGDANAGKSNLLYYLIRELQAGYTFNLYNFGLEKYTGGIKINSLEELEQICNSVVIIDEFYSLFDLEDRKKRRSIEKSLRLIFHHNNILLLCGLPENFKKYISSMIDMFIFQKSTLSQFINGSRIKEICLNYSGNELGSSILNLKENQAIIYEKHYEKMEVPYMKDYDTKRENRSIICAKNVPKKVEK